MHPAKLTECLLHVTLQGLKIKLVGGPAISLPSTSRDMTMWTGTATTSHEAGDREAAYGVSPFLTPHFQPVATSCHITCFLCATSFLHLYKPGCTVTISSYTTTNPPKLAHLHALLHPYSSFSLCNQSESFIPNPC